MARRGRLLLFRDKSAEALRATCKHEDRHRRSEFAGVRGSRHGFAPRPAMKNGQTKPTHPVATKAPISEAKPLLLDIHQLATTLNVGRTTIETWTRSRRIPSLKLGRVLRYDLSKVMSALAAYERKTV